MTSTDTVKLIDEYKNSNNQQKKMLQKKYGERQMRLIEKYLTTEYLQVCIYDKVHKITYMEINDLD